MVARATARKGHDEVSEILRRRIDQLLDYIGSAEECADCAACAETGEAPCGLHALVADVVRELPARSAA